MAKSKNKAKKITKLFYPNKDEKKAFSKWAETYNIRVIDDYAVQSEERKDEIRKATSSWLDYVPEGETKPVRELFYKKFQILNDKGVVCLPKALHSLLHGRIVDRLLNMKREEEERKRKEEEARKREEEERKRKEEKKPKPEQPDLFDSICAPDACKYQVDNRTKEQLHDDIFVTLDFLDILINKYREKK